MSSEANRYEATSQEDLITFDQLKYVGDLARRKGINADDESMLRFQLPAYKLNRSAASILIDELKAMRPAWEKVS